MDFPRSHVQESAKVPNSTHLSASFNYATCAVRQKRNVKYIHMFPLATVVYPLHKYSYLQWAFNVIM